MAKKLKCWRRKDYREGRFGIERKDNPMENIFFYKEKGEWKSSQNTKKQLRFKTHGSKQSAKSYMENYLKRHDKC